MSKRSFKKWLILEEHSIVGGLGSSILEWKNDYDINTPTIFRLAAKDQFIHDLGDQSYMRANLNIDSKSIIEIISND